MKYACGITLYNPTDDIVERINNYSDVFDLVYLFDNTESKEKHLNFYSELNKIINNQPILYQLLKFFYFKTLCFSFFYFAT